MPGSSLSYLISGNIPALETCDVEQPGHKAAKHFVSATVKPRVRGLACCRALFTSAHILNLLWNNTSGRLGKLTPVYI